MGELLILWNFLDDNVARLRKIFKNLCKMCTFEHKIGKTDIKKKLAPFDIL